MPVAARALWIDERLRFLGLSRGDLASRLGLKTKRQIERWIAGRVPHRTTQYDLALALHLPPEQVYALFDMAGSRIPHLSIQGEQDADGEYRPVSHEEFYRYYAAKIATGKRDVWVTSDGFNMRSLTSQGYAGVMGPAFRAALANGAVVYRYQMTETMHINWIDELIQVKAAYPRQFRVFVNPGVAEVANVCAVDPGSDHCVAERFEGQRGGFCQGTVAADYSFRLNDRGRAREAQDVVECAIDAAETTELGVDGLEQLRSALFAQRSEQLRRWCTEQSGEFVDVTDSGVFDELVISDFVRKAVVGTGRQKDV